MASSTSLPRSPRRLDSLRTHKSCDYKRCRPLRSCRCSSRAVRIRSALVGGAIRHREISRLRRWHTTSGVQPRTKLPGASACSAVHGVPRAAGAAIDAANIGCGAVLRRSSKMIGAGAAANVPAVSAASASSPGARSPVPPAPAWPNHDCNCRRRAPRPSPRRTFVSGSATRGRRISSISPAAMVSCFGVGAFAGPHRVSSRRVDLSDVSAEDICPLW